MVIKYWITPLCGSSLFPFTYHYSHTFSLLSSSEKIPIPENLKAQKVSLSPYSINQYYTIQKSIENTILKKKKSLTLKVLGDEEGRSGKKETISE